MRFFRKAKKNDGWLTIAFLGDGVAATSVKMSPAARPVVDKAAFFPGPRLPTPDVLEKIGKDLGIGSYRCTTVLGGNEYQMLSVEAPNVPPDELKTAVRWRLKDMLDYHVDDATIDVLDIPVDKSGASRTHNMFAVSARNSIIEARQALFGGAGVDLRVIDIPEMAQRNIAALVEPEGRGLAMLSFSEDSGLLTVSHAGELYLSRRIDATLAQLTDPDHERKHAVFDRITLELQRSLDHFDRQFHYINVAKLVLAPSVITGLDEYLSSNLYTPVEKLDLASVLDLSAAPALADVAEQQRFFMPLGAAMRVEEVVL